MNSFRSLSALPGSNSVRSFRRVAIACAVLAIGALGHAAPPAAKADATHPLGVGAKVPDAMLRATDNSPVELKDALGAKPTVLIFYRGSWCPYCNRHLAALAEIEPQLLALGYQIIALSPDTTEGLRKMTDKNKLNYRLLSDREMHASTAFGVAFRVSETTASNYTSKGVPLAPIPGGDGFWLPVPAVYVVGRDGVIGFAHSNPDISKRLAPADVLAAATTIATAAAK